jgi:DNA-binding NarL/FixJ family response regulator
MIVIGVRADQGLAWPDQLKSSSGIRVIRLSALQEAAAVDICVYVFARVRQGLSQAVTEISAANRTKFVVIDQVCDIDIAMLLVKAGCHGYLSCDDQGFDLRRISSVLLAGRYWVPRVVLERIVEEMTVDRDAIAESLCQLLSPREHEVALWISRGLSNKRIAREMGVTERTIKAHLSHIFQKTPVSDRLELALLMKGELPERVRINLQ